MQHCSLILRTHLTPGYVANVHAWFTVDIRTALRVVVILDAVRRNISMDNVAGGQIHAEVLACNVLTPR